MSQPVVRIALGPMDLALASGPESHDQGRRLLYHQQQTRARLRDHDIVVNSYPTGAGKTHAALLRLLELPRAGVRANALLIAPTNELVRQHARDAQSFCQEHGLPHHVLELTAPGLAAESLPDAFTRSGDRLNRILTDAGIARGGPPAPILAVGNPDLFYLALYFRYGRLDQANLFVSIIRTFGYLIVDELHYYDARQLAAFLFFTIVSREYGYFAQEDRRLSLLTATPEPGVRTLLGRLGLRVSEITPVNDPPDGDRAPSLAPADLTVFRADPDIGLHTLVPTDREAIGMRLAGGQQGAIISSALWRINQIWAALRHTTFGGRIGAITGAETSENRAAAGQADLILATPTVDIGYNFGRPDKPRQGLDFLYFDARYADELMQRLGRAARVLGRPETGHPSDVTAVVDDRLFQILQPLDGGSIGRADLATLLGSNPDAARDRLFGYFDSGAVGEAVLPLHRLAEMTAIDQQADVERVYEAVRDVFAPHSTRTFQSLRGGIRRFLDLEKLHRDPPSDHAGHVERGLDSFLREKKARPGDRDRLKAGIVAGGNALRRVFDEWWKDGAEQHALMAARFAFRDSFQAPVAVVWDPGHHLSRANQARYDLLHLLENFELEHHVDARAWRDRSGLPIPESRRPADAYVTIAGIRPPDARLRLRLHLTTDLSRDAWLERRTANLVAFHDLHLGLDGGQVPSQVAATLAERWVVGLAVRREGGRAAGPLRRLCSVAGFFPRDLVVECDDGRSVECLVLLGTPALLAGDELLGPLRAEQRSLGQTSSSWIL